MTSPSSSESPTEMAARLKAKPYYKPVLESLDPSVRAIYESYAGIPPAQVLSHIQTVRDQAWELYPYPCIGMFAFTKTYVSRNRAYPAVLERLLSSDRNETLLDLGCGFGQELRTLAAAGVPPSRLFGLDVSDGFIELGFKLFQDMATMQSQFTVADLLSVPDIPEQLDGKFNIILAASFFHLFGWDDQVTLASRAVRMLRPEPGSMVFGHLLGQDEAHEFAVPEVPSKKIFFHNPDSFRRMWRVVGEASATQWRVEVVSSDKGIDDLRKGNPALRILMFSVERLRRQEHVSALLRPDQ